MTSLIRDPLVWILLVVLIAAVFAVMRARRTNLALRRTKNDLETGLGQAQGQVARLQEHIALLNTQHKDDLAGVRADAESSTKAVLKSAMGTLQSLAEEQQLLLDGLLKKYGNDTEVLADLMSVDHTGSQFGRRAKGISVLCGGWLGRREGAASVYDVARSAQGRIKDFDRVSIHAQASVSVSSKAVEPLAVVLAELLDNATTYSAPGTPVEVNIQAVPTGVCFIVDDAGLGMDQETKDRAATLLSADGPVDITGLGDPPHFGFAVCGMLAARYGFAVSVGSVSPYGGVRAVIRVPESLLSADGPTPAEPVREPEAREAAPQRLTPVPVGPSHVVGTTSGGLPKRRRRQGPIAVVPSPQAAPETDEQTSEPDSEVTASRLGAFARGTQLGRTTNTTEGPDHQ
ncbi:MULTISPECIES: ATP-binding protein [Streptomyces]|uniref:histidine kinase n=1 Tax=Streptomyces viridosporus (strain ATCC 14672 / DSM 40746 / JCM 4963 / KCTC 9882 / NRRL B-12104 / FH 1290) TaxID=566461 RepID=D6A2E4_STRV1|nr:MULTISPECIES: ATP-binding protein [Streptomyces]EFE71382.1 sensor histidine kinase [Streptomyces viridosporus ATCC 14672]